MYKYIILITLNIVFVRALFESQFFNSKPVSIIIVTRVVLEKCKFTGLIEISFFHVDLWFFFRIVHWTLKASKFDCT